MSKVILDQELKTKLHDLREQIELCDTDGRTMGRDCSTSWPNRNGRHSALTRRNAADS